MTDLPGCPACATRRACLLAPLAPDLLHMLQPAIDSRRLPDGAVLVREGERAASVQVLKVGQAIASRAGLLGTERPIGLAGRGTAFGQSGLTGDPEPVTARAAGPVRACTIPHAALQAVATRDPGFAAHLRAQPVVVYGRYASWSEGVRVRGVVNQLAYHLLLLAQAQGSALLDLPTHGALARLMGTTRESVARAFGTLRAESGIEARGQRRCEIRREALLQRLAAAGG